MVENPLRSPTLTERLLPWLMLGLLLLFTYAFFVAAPYAGFRHRPDGTVAEIYVPNSALQPGDRLLQVGPVPWEDFQRNFRQTLFQGVLPGDLIPLVVKRADETLTIPWVFPGFTANELLQRLIGDWFLAYVYWFAGTYVLLSIRPKDLRWNLLTAFYYVTALWLITGSGAGAAHIWETATVLQVAAWLSVPVYWQLHWVFPKPLRRLPKALWWILHGLAGAMAVATVVGFLPPRSYAYGLLLAIAGAILLLILHFILQPAQRRDIGFLAFFVLLAIVPLGVVSFLTLSGLPLHFTAGGASLLALPLLPIGYFYAAFRRRLGGMELRRNRLLSLYLFVIMFVMILIIFFMPVGILLGLSPDALGTGILIGLLALLVAIFSYARFQRFVEHRLLGVPLAPEHLLETYAARIATRLDRPGLVSVLRDEVLPSLLVRQSALVHLDEAGPVTTLYQIGLSEECPLDEEDLLMLLTEVERHRSPLQGEAIQKPHTLAWVRVALILRLGNQVVGLWLLGHRDPDDVYAQTEINVLQSLADQTAIALAHIIQSELLRAAYKANIDRLETERASLARELHDHILNGLAELRRMVELHASSPEFLEAYTQLADSLRQTITEIRPPMLDYGLRAALASLVDALEDRVQNNPIIEFDVPETQTRYEADLEQHLFRIVQQACENALRHAQAHKLRIYGHLEQDHIDVIVEDDGVGLESGERLDLAGLLARQHFGLAGMHERATLIGANLLIDSNPGHGTRIRIIWPSHR